MKNHIGANGISAPSAKYIFPILFIITDVRYFGNDKSKKKIDKSIKFIKAAGAGETRGRGGDAFEKLFREKFLELLKNF